MSLVERAGEKVARGMDRRRFLKRTGASAFGLVAAWTVEGIGMPSALAAVCQNRSSNCACAPIGPYCNTVESSWCEGSRCGDDCIPYPGIYEPSGCWCTRECCYREDGRTFCGIYRCCDCLCNRQNPTACSCKRFLQTYPRTA